MRYFILFPALIFLSACAASDFDFSFLERPDSWSKQTSENIETVDISSLKQWWKKFNDPALDDLVESALTGSPDRLIAEAKIAKARGLRRSSRSSLFPQVGVSGSVGREDTGIRSASYPDSFYDAGFDASFEIDVFGSNRKNLSAAEAHLSAAQEEYHDVSLTLIAEIMRNYIDFRAAQNQLNIAQKNLTSQEKTLTLIEDLNRLGEAPRLDVERAINLVNTTRASVPEFKRQADNARLRLSILTGDMPEKLALVLKNDAEIPGANVQSVLLTPTQVLSVRPDIRAAMVNLEAKTALHEAAIAEIFPAFDISGFYGVADGALANSITPWNVALGAAVSLLDFGRIEGRIDAAEAREKQAYEGFRKTVLAAVVEVETALSDYTYINDKHASLRRAYESAEKALELSQILHKEGEVSFLDVLDAQRTVNNAQATMVSARAAQSESLVRLYKSLAVY